VADSDDELYWYGFKETEKGVDDNNPSA
jgi:hypothetical protein